jgi:hypothetical protein
MKRDPHTDAAVYAEMEAVIKKHMQAAMMECATLAQDLTVADPMQVVANLNTEFAWYHLSDRFSDAVDMFRGDLCDLGLSYYEAYNRPRHMHSLAAE